MPSNIGLDGKIGGATGGKWYGGVYGWGFSVDRAADRARSPTAPRTASGLAGLRNAFLLTGDDKYLDVWRKQIDAINANRRMTNGRWEYPRMYGDNGWYALDAAAVCRERAWSCTACRCARTTPSGSATTRWLDYLAGKNPDYPERALRRDLAAVRQRVAGHAARHDDARHAAGRRPDEVQPGHRRSAPATGDGRHRPGPRRQHAHRPAALLRRRRSAGPACPTDVAALVERLTADEAVVTLVNVNQLEPRTLIVQGGAYGEHQIVSVAGRRGDTPVGGRQFAVTLAPGARHELTLRVQRHANQPTLALPWDRS